MAVLISGAGALLCAAAPARADDPPPRLEIHGLVALDGIVATDPSLGGVPDSELAGRLRLDVRHAAGGLVDIKLDFWGRLGIANLNSDDGNPSAQELRELSVSLRNLGGKVDLTLGRFPTPGGFWLIADGARLDVRYTDWLSQSVYGGLRAFTTQRLNADLDFNQPVALPLAGTSLLLHHRLVDASVTFTWARDALDLPTTPDANDVRPQRDVVDELFLDGQLMAMPHPSLLLIAGASLGSRYDVQFQTTDPTSPVQIGVATLGAVSAYGIAAWRPLARLRLNYTINYERIRLIDSNLPTSAQVLPTGDGSFLDNGVRADVLLWKALRLDAEYRFRWRDGNDTEHHAVVGLRADNLWRGLGAFVSVGLDEITLDAVKAGVSPDTTRILYSGGLSYVRDHFDLNAGILFTDGIGSGLLFSQPVPGMPANNVPAQLFPYVFESNRIAFVRLFGNWRSFFGGLDIEENLDSVQLRAMAQLGWFR